MKHRYTIRRCDTNAPDLQIVAEWSEVAERAMQAISPKYLRVRDRLARLIETKRLSPGAQLPTIREIARSSGVGLRTASRAARAQIKLFRNIEKELGRPDCLLKEDMGEPAKVQNLLDGLTPGRAASRDETALREGLRDMLRRVAMVRRAYASPKDRLLRVNFQRGKNVRGSYEEVSNWFPISNTKDLIPAAG